mmetsp:Transcript_26024/g.53263  ORF Transcript_26024/g.53263 Transcript_26024/m.53263 type:complete len:376 (-) Transcript_26024:24-1151(-)
MNPTPLMTARREGNMERPHHMSWTHGAAPASGVSADASDLLKVSDLEQELARLRESTKEALQQSWSEVEALQRSSAENAARADRLEAELAESIRREREWRAKFEEMQARFLVKSRGEEAGGEAGAAPPEPTRDDQEEKNNFIKNTVRTLKRRSFILMKGGDDVSDDEMEFSASDSARLMKRSESDRSGQPSCIRRDAKAAAENDQPSYCSDSSSTLFSAGDASLAAFASIRSLIDSCRNWKGDGRRRLEAEIFRQFSQLEAERDAAIAELGAKVTCRESAISSLEDTAELQGQTVNALRNELEEVKATKNEREDCLMEEILFLRQRVCDKKKTIIKQAKKMSECQEYIVEITNELERMYNEQEEQSASEQQSQRQ